MYLSKQHSSKYTFTKLLLDWAVFPGIQVLGHKQLSSEIQHSKFRNSEIQHSARAIVVDDAHFISWPCMKKLANAASVQNGDKAVSAYITLDC